MGTFPFLEKKGYLFWKGDLVVEGTVLKLDWEALEARISAASRTVEECSVPQSCRTTPVAEQ